jgi:hypothetical protein
MICEACRARLAEPPGWEEFSIVQPPGVVLYRGVRVVAGVIPNLILRHLLRFGHGSTSDLIQYCGPRASLLNVKAYVWLIRQGLKRVAAPVRIVRGYVLERIAA